MTKSGINTYTPLFESKFSPTNSLASSGTLAVKLSQNTTINT